MTLPPKIKRVRWGVRAALTLGVAASIAGNVLHAHDGAISRVISAWSPLALLITIELIARVPVHRRSLAVGRLGATAVIAGIAAWVSYWHMAAVAARYGETGASPYLIPLSVDGLVVVASICLVELGSRIRDAEATFVFAGPVPSASGPVFDHVQPIGPVPAPAVAPEPADSLSTRQPRERKPQPSSRERIERAHQRTPQATNEQLAKRLNLSTKTISRWRPERPAPELTEVNGHDLELEEVNN